MNWEGRYLLDLGEEAFFFVGPQETVRSYKEFLQVNHLSTVFRHHTRITIMCTNSCALSSGFFVRRSVLCRRDLFRHNKRHQCVTISSTLSMLLMCHIWCEYIYCEMQSPRTIVRAHLLRYSLLCRRQRKPWYPGPAIFMQSRLGISWFSSQYMCLRMFSP